MTLGAALADPQGKHVVKAISSSGTELRRLPNVARRLSNILEHMIQAGSMKHRPPDGLPAQGDHVLWLLLGGSDRGQKSLLGHKRSSCHIFQMTKVSSTLHFRFY